jgi:hypothetical protein
MPASPHPQEDFVSSQNDVPTPPDTSWVARPEAGHRWLEQFVGEWEFAPPGPPGAELAAQPVLVQTIRSLNGIWIVGESPMPVPDGTVGSTLLTLGYDPARNRFVGTWIGSMMTHLWIYEGQLDASGRVLDLDTTGPDMTGSGGEVPYRDSYEIVSADHYVLRSYARGEDGGWTEFMAVDYRRRR